MLTKGENNPCNPGREKYICQTITNIYTSIVIRVIWDSYKVV